MLRYLKMPIRFFSNILNVRPEDKLKHEKTFKSLGGFYTKQYHQYFKGIRVEGGQCSFLYQNGKIKGVKGQYANIQDFNPIPAITKTDALKTFSNYFGSVADSEKNVNIDLLIKDVSHNSDGSKEGASWALVYKVSSHTHPEICYIDAHSNKVVGTEPAYINYSLGTFQTCYHGDSVLGYTEYNSSSGRYYLHDTTRGSGIYTRKFINNTSVDFTDDNNIWTDSEMGIYKMALDVHWTLGQIYDVMSGIYGFESYNGNDGVINAVVNSDMYTYYNFADSILSYGYGNSIYRPMASVDIIAHEFGHAILNKTTGWGIGTQELRALHEGFADVWGILLEHHIAPSSDIWKSGEDVTVDKDCERNFANPYDPNANTQIASTYGVNLGIVNNNDSHVVGGICSRWLYLLVNGGSGTNEKGDQYNVLPLGLNVVEQLVAHTVLTSYYLEDCMTFSSVRKAFIEAAEDLGDYFLANQVVNAWYAVGVGDNSYTSSASITGPFAICNSTLFTISNLSDDYDVTWSINNNAFTLSPSDTLCYVSHSQTTQSETATLSATISRNGQVITTLSKEIVFQGTNINIACTQVIGSASGLLIDNSFFITGSTATSSTVSATSETIYGGFNLTLQSERFRGMNISFTGINQPTGFVHNENTVSFTPFEDLFNYNLTLLARSDEGCSDFDLQMAITPPDSNMEMNDFYIWLSQNQTTLYLSLYDAAGEELPSGQIQLGEWSFTITRAATGQQVYSQQVVGADASVSISSWASGLYIVTATYNGNLYSRKFVVN
ncbi:MAG: M4 family metallopeptidase [Prevotella sp.]|nr:M4 family metallopeptidase [Prevotella sp.]